MKAILATMIVLMSMPAMAQRSADSCAHPKTYVLSYCKIGLRTTVQTTDICALAPGVYVHHVKWHTKYGKDIVHMPTTSVNDIASLTAGVYQKQRGGPLYVEGGRPEGNLYVIDGMWIMPR